MRILIGADTVPTPSNVDEFIAGDAEALLGESLLHLLDSSDYRIVNLEVPLCSECSPIPKCGPNICANPNSVEGFKAMGIDCVSMANNHILDEGAEGFQQTIQTLNAANIGHFGAGANLDESKRPFYLNDDEIRVGFLAFAEHEFSIAGINSPGANPYTDSESPKLVKNLKDKCDYVVVLYHGGVEHYRYPTPQLQSRCRLLAEFGADYIICQHSHCIGCRELYNGSTIVYGQGNFLFDAEELECWQTSLLVELNFGSCGSSITYHPICKDGSHVSLATDSRKSEILTSFECRSADIASNNCFIENQFREYARESLNWSLRSFVPGSSSLFYKAMNKLTHGNLAAMLLGRNRLLCILNKVECEAHREVLITGLKDLIS